MHRLEDIGMDERQGFFLTEHAGTAFCTTSVYEIIIRLKEQC
jgi:hypothetical protein